MIGKRGIVKDEEEEKEREKKEDREWKKNLVNNEKEA